MRSRHQTLGESLLRLHNRTGAHRYDAPSLTAAQGDLDAILHRPRFVPLRNEQRPESSWLSLGLDRAVVRPATGTSMIPMPA